MPEFENDQVCWAEASYIIWQKKNIVKGSELEKDFVGEKTNICNE